MHFPTDRAGYTTAIEGVLDDMKKTFVLGPQSKGGLILCCSRISKMQ